MCRWSLAFLVVAACLAMGGTASAADGGKREDTLKERVPIWKKEVATDGEYWVEDHA